MTQSKREPFATEVRDGLRIPSIFIGNFCFSIHPDYYNDGPTTDDIVGKINSSHEARVKEAVREALEEFKRLAIKCCIENKALGAAEDIEELPKESEGEDGSQ